MITNGTLSKLDVTINGSFNFFGLSVSPENLHLQYDATANTYAIGGGLSVQLPDAIKVDASITSADPTSTKAPLVINADGSLDVSNFKAHVDVAIAGFELIADVKYVSAGTNYAVNILGSLKTPGGIEFSAKVDIANGQLKDIGLEDPAGIAVGDTGLFITWSCGELDNINTSSPTIIAAATLTYGKQIGDIPPIIQATAGIVIDANHLLLTADPKVGFGGITIPDASQHILGIQVLGPLGSATGSIDLNRATGVYKASLDVHMMGIVEIQGPST